MRNKPLAPLAPILVLAVCLLGACEKTLVYGERSGFNLALRSDAAAAVPIEVNAGLQRRVVGLIPGAGEVEDGRPSGEAVNMVSRFDIDYADSENDLFGGRLKVSSAFASGGAATAVAGNVKVVEAIVGPLGFRVADDPLAREANLALTNHIAADLDDGADNRTAYLALAKALDLRLADGPTPTARAVKTIDDPANARGNIEIARLLGLID